MGSSPDVQIGKGREALLYFHNDSVVYENYELSFDALLNQVSKGKPSIFLEGFGMAIESLDGGSFFSFGNAKVKSAMQDLASRAAGRVPSQSSFFSALSDEAQNYSFEDAAGFVAVETGKKVGEGLVETGNILIDTAKSVGMFLPLAVLLGLGFIFYSKVRKAA